MKFLLDACVWGGAPEALRAAGFDVIWAGDWAEDPGDAEILARAFAAGRILVTLDKDFGELAVRQNAPHCGINRLTNISARRQGEASLYIAKKYPQDLAARAIITVEPGRVRIRAGAGEASRER